MTHSVYVTGWSRYCKMWRHIEGMYNVWHRKKRCQKFNKCVTSYMGNPFNILQSIWNESFFSSCLWLTSKRSFLDVRRLDVNQSVFSDKQLLLRQKKEINVQFLNSLHPLNQSYKRKFSFKKPKFLFGTWLFISYFMISMKVAWCQVMLC